MANSLMTGAAVPGRKPPKMSAEDRRWRAEDDMRALMRAEDIKRDKERLNAVQQHAEAVQRAAAMPKITVKTSGRGAR